MAAGAAGGAPQLAGGLGETAGSEKESGVGAAGT